MRLIKIGGGQAINLEGLAMDLSSRSQDTVIVLGAHDARDELHAALSHEKRTVRSPSGMESVVTDDVMIGSIAMAYAGLRACQVVETLQRHGVNACHLSGMDGGLIRGTRKRGIRIQENDRTVLLPDRSAKPSEVNTSLLLSLVEAGIVPVITIPIMDEQGMAMNCDNDAIIQRLCETMPIGEVIQLIEAPGLLMDIQDPESRMAEVSEVDIELLYHQVQGGMKRKLHVIRQMLKASDAVIHLWDGRVDRPLSQQIGTRIERSFHASHCES